MRGNSNQLVSAMIIENLQSKGYTLPDLPESKTLFSPVVVAGSMIYVSGQIPAGFGELKQYCGAVGRDFTTEQAKKIAAICALNAIAQVQRHLGSLANVKRCVKLTVFVNATPTFVEAHLVANGASEVMLAAFGESSKHARSAIGVAQLPFGVAVEVEAIFEG
jgi:enamine deaminase RidA (YjgF/YER057c/UK114 family)